MTVWENGSSVGLQNLRSSVRFRQLSPNFVLVIQLVRRLSSLCEILRNDTPKKRLAMRTLVRIQPKTNKLRKRGRARLIASVLKTEDPFKRVREFESLRFRQIRIASICSSILNFMVSRSYHGPC